ncbi:MAG TPA: CAP domain-containing protein [Acidimicrobiales bacterium]|nr:CAP domain-containing protein [Acidimicrobiales bacterium]
MVGMRRFGRRAVVAGLFTCVAWGGLSSAAVTAATTTSTTPGTPPAVGASGWLDAVNQARAQAGLGPLQEDPVLSERAMKHPQYLVESGLPLDQLRGPEVQSNPAFSVDGNAATSADSMVYDVSPTEGTTADDWVGSYLTDPVTAVALLDPSARRVGFGSFAAAGHAPFAGASVMAFTTTGVEPGGPPFPVRWPGPGSSVAL